MDVGKRSLISVNGTLVKEVYRVKGAVAHCGLSRIYTIALFHGDIKLLKKNNKSIRTSAKF